ncbi:hypothetical protein [Nocardia abscessus]|uniref:hypothetical protein n=1 Tax=Nocardia abscessus TaxID=120957 RepID=UPI00245813BB|nr:hypothetical protein [Nocardia abscessus]
MTNPSAPNPSGGAPRRRGDWLLQLALCSFALGLLAIVVIFAIPILTDGEPGLWFYFGAMLAPLGFVLALVFALRSGRRSR